ncbi:hypothetical protein NHH03_15820 [Stieleria sp. TO1_6]|uniref:hypothetical protein n=1 Tax=Stieleria tagensis TaxID=2956795 RepID=UPI00209BB834|nr:hypothetical protein [Stieleria tagensis]MCO8123216.1 hypothetical protein [Stieleria tagensis]
MAHFEKAGSGKNSSVQFATHPSDRKQIWRATVSHGTKFDVVLWGGDSLTVESPGGLLTFTEGKSPGKDRRLFTITANSYGTLELQARHSNGSVWDTLTVNVASQTDKLLCSQAIKLLKHKSVAKMQFQIGPLQVTPARMRGVSSLLQSGEVFVRYSPSLPLGAYLRGQDELQLPYQSISTDEQKANACHELSHALMDQHYAGKPLKRTVTESVGYIVQFIFFRVARPKLTVDKVKQIPVAIAAFEAAGEVIANKRVSQSAQTKLREALIANGIYSNQSRMISYDGI